MIYPISLKGILFPFLVGALLAHEPVRAGCENISLIYPLYIISDTGWLQLVDASPVALASRYVRSERNSDMVIALPDAARGKYRLRFLESDSHLLFEIRNIRDSLLIVEKYNFQRAGLFQYELFKDNILVERNTFIIKKD